MGRNAKRENTRLERFLFWLTNTLRSYSTPGLLFGLTFFGFALTPSLLPRWPVLQGALSGISFSIGYGVGVFVAWLWRYLEIPEQNSRWNSRCQSLAFVIIVVAVPALVWKAAGWQDTVRRLNDLEPLKSSEPLLIGGIALLLAVLVISLSRQFARFVGFVSGHLNSYIPRRVSNVLGVCIVALILGSMVDGLVFKTALRVADSASRELDRLMDEGTPQPQDPVKTGSPASHIRWGTLGRLGRSFISTGPSGARISAVTGEPAKVPIRVYVGLRSARSPAKRAKLALRELQRVKAFDRSVLIVAMPTGTGWLDGSGVDPVEYLHHGDTAIVSAQYSYLASWLSLLVEPGYGEDMARALFTEIYRYWSQLPREHRPKLYLHGLSLGAFSSESSVQLFEVAGDPFNGAVWAGPPFASPHWRAMVDNRNPGTPFWLPTVSNSSYVRFTGQKNALTIPGARWGPLRIVYVQYANDPITFFDFSSIYRRPEWLAGERGPDVSPDIRWFPVVTFLQGIVDMVTSGGVPRGHGHRYAAANYIDAWVAVTDPPRWTAQQIEELKTRLTE